MLARTWQRWRAFLGWGKGPKALSRWLDVPLDVLRDEPGYRSATIPKRRGGTRDLLIPNDGTKLLQRRILRRLLTHLSAHTAATGFERGLSIVHNALPHTSRAVVVRVDLVDFFPATAERRVERYFRRIGWSAGAASILTRWTTRDGGLPQGAPTSPRLANLVNRGLDARLNGLARRLGGVYTRYADDITLSFDESPAGLVRRALKKVHVICESEGYEVNAAKISVRRRGERQLVTGLVVNDRVNLPREVRRRLRAVRHRLDIGRPATMTEEQWRGWAALEAMIEKQRS